jgi:hypothetical protein
MKGERKDPGGAQRKELREVVYTGVQNDGIYTRYSIASRSKVVS